MCTGHKLAARIELPETELKFGYQAVDRERAVAHRLARMWKFVQIPVLYTPDCLSTIPLLTLVSILKARRGRQKLSPLWLQLPCCRQIHLWSARILRDRLQGLIN